MCCSFFSWFSPAFIPYAICEKILWDQENVSLLIKLSLRILPSFMILLQLLFTMLVVFISPLPPSSPLHLLVLMLVAVQSPSHVQLSNPSMPGLPVLHHFLKFVQVHVHCKGVDIQPSHPLKALFSFCLWSFPTSGTFPMNQLFTSDDQNTGVSASASVLPTSSQGWFSLKLTGLIY